MFEVVTPESIGIKSKDLISLTDYINSLNLRLHTLSICKGNKLFYNINNGLFNETSIHRMYSQTKSFVSLAIGCLLDEGKIHLEDKISSYFVEDLPSIVDKELSNQTIEDNLKMGTCLTCENWFSKHNKNRAELYFKQKSNRSIGSKFEYDSAGSQVLGMLVEKLTGKSLFDYLNEKILSHLDYFKDSYILKDIYGSSWADSGLMTSPLSMLEIGNFLLNKGKANGVNLLSESYIEKATSRYLDTSTQGIDYKSYSYGYQIWGAKDGYCFLGMGGQITLMYPNGQFVVALTGDGFDKVKEIDLMIKRIQEILENASKPPLDEDLDSSTYLLKNNKVDIFKNVDMNLDLVNKLDGKIFKSLNKNDLIDEVILNKLDNSSFSLTFKHEELTKQFIFKNKETTKSTLKDIYSKERIVNLPSYDSYLVYLGIESIGLNKMQLQGQIIGDYLGIINLLIKYEENTLILDLKTTAENFLLKYNGLFSFKEVI